MLGLRSRHALCCMVGLCSGTGLGKIAVGVENAPDDTMLVSDIFVPILIFSNLVFLQSVVWLCPFFPVMVSFRELTESKQYRTAGPRKEVIGPARK